MKQTYLLFALIAIAVLMVQAHPEAKADPTAVAEAEASAEAEAFADAMAIADAIAMADPEAVDWKGFGSKIKRFFKKHKSTIAKTVLKIVTTVLPLVLGK
uniref:Venom peptide ECTX1-Rm18a n=1 Tax=Rhytidoponera metallica TaxID=148364 RepID=A0A8U0LU11_RHYMT|nr:venom peptide precursor ECTX1-Rm18a [Rhytidoponera metallica]